ncbi:NUDIX hydrolase [Patescibacteria group bacterium]
MPQEKSKQPLPKHAKRVFEGIIFDTYQWKQKLYDGSFATFEKLKRADTVVVFPVDKTGRIIISTQEQPGIKPFIGVPAGRVEKGESILSAAKRELLEESGYEAEKVIHWYSYQPYSKMIWNIHFFIAKGCKKISKQTLDPGEKIKLKIVSFNEFFKLVCNGKLPDKHLQIKFLEAKLDEKKMEKIKKLFLQ